MEYISRYDDIFINNLLSLGFSHLGSWWFKNESDNIRLRLWINDEIDFWIWRSSKNKEDNELRFRGKIYSIEDLKWVLEHCFGYKF